MRRHSWILADADDSRPNHHIIGIFRSEEGLIDAANDYQFSEADDGGDDPKPIKTLNDMYEYEICYYHFVEGE